MGHTDSVYPLRDYALISATTRVFTSIDCCPNLTYIHLHLGTSIRPLKTEDSESSSLQHFAQAPDIPLGYLRLMLSSHDGLCRDNAVRAVHWVKVVLTVGIVRDKPLTSISMTNQRITRMDRFQNKVGKVVRTMKLIMRSVPKLSALPIELWEHIIDYLRYDLDALMRCSLVCRVWYRRCQIHAPQQYYRPIVTFSHRNEVVRVGRQRTEIWKGPKHLSIRGATSEDGERRSIPHLGTWSAMFAGRWTRVKILSVEKADWRTLDIQPDVFRNLASFTSITRLLLRDITFPTVTTFGRLMCALQNLDELYCHSGVRFLTHHIHHQAFPRRNSRMKLTTVVLDRASVNDIITLFVYIDVCPTLVTIGLGHFSEPLRVEDLGSRKLQSFLQSAGTSLRLLQLSLMLGEHAIDLSYNTNLVGLNLMLNVSSTLVDFDHSWLPRVIQSASNSFKLSSVFIHFNLESLIISDPIEINQVLMELVHGSCSQLDLIFTFPGFAKLVAVYIFVKPPDVAMGTTRALWSNLVQSEMPNTRSRQILKLGCFRPKGA